MDPRKCKRVVTGVDDRGRSVIVSDGPAPTILGAEPSAPGWVAEHWVTADVPPSLDGPDLAGEEWQLAPRPGGTIFRIFAVPGAGTPGSEIEHHTTDTVDYIVVLTGRIWLVMDEGEAELGPGDCVILRGTAHSWVNRGEEMCVAAAVLIDAGRNAHAV
jgi:quercetin dioxygenase-like cupin family protein